MYTRSPTTFWYSTRTCHEKRWGGNFELVLYNMTTRSYRTSAQNASKIHIVEMHIATLLDQAHNKPISILIRYWFLSVRSLTMLLLVHVYKKLWDDTGLCRWKTTERHMFLRRHRARPCLRVYSSSNGSISQEKNCCLLSNSVITMATRWGVTNIFHNWNIEYCLY